MEDRDGGKLFDGTDAWAFFEVVQSDVGDERLSKRLARMVAALTVNPTCSLPEACQTWADTKAAYRFLENEEIEPAAILSGHRLSTLQRMSRHPVVLAIQDTTTVNFSGHPATKGLGPIGGRRAPHHQDSAQGFFVHSCLAVTPSGTSLGLLGQKQWVRGGGEGDAGDKGKPDASPPVANEKESARWTEMLKASTKGLPAKTKVITITDREGDFYDLFAAAVEFNQDILVRATHNRHLARKQGRLWGVLDKAKIVGTMVAEIPRADSRPSRTATLELRAAWVRIPSPKVVTPLTLSAVLAREVSPPAGQQPIEWRLLTTLTVVSLEDARTCVEFYTKRWLIERFHYTLKSGCQVEKLQLESADRLQRAMSVYSIVAWRLLYLTYVARVDPTAPCIRFLSDSEWKALFCQIHRTNRLPETPPSIATALLWIAKLGGFLARKRDGKPGVQVIWRGYRRLQDMAALWEILHPTD